MDLKQQIASLGKQAKRAATQLALMSAEQKSAVLLAMADELEAQRTLIVKANKQDLEAGRQARLGAALMDRLDLNEKRLTAMVDGVRHVAALPDPVGETIAEQRHQNGMRIVTRRVPIGVIAIIYESRPNVTADAAVLCVRSGNAVILRGGKEARQSNAAIAAALATGGARAGMPEGAVQLVATVDREAVRELVQLEGIVDMAIPRGGEGLIRAVAELARVPVIKHYKGVCHTYVDASADLDMAVAVCENAKCQRPGVCNAMETLLVDRPIAVPFLQAFAKRVADYDLEMRGDDEARRIVPEMVVACEPDWDEEYLDMILSVRVVDGVHEAVEHIARHGSHHSDAVVASDKQVQRTFVAGVDSAAVYVNASTRFTDGAEFGMGAEIGISTDKLHARGPMGLRELTTYKYVVEGDGQVR